jgi:hypothetical protein
MFEDFIKEALDGAPKEVVDMLFKIAATRADDLCRTQVARRKFREANASNPEMLESFDAMCERYDLNVMVVQALGNIKAMLSDFDGNNFSFVNSHENIRLLRNIITVAMISGRNVGDQMCKIQNMEEPDHDDRTGDASD